MLKTAPKRPRQQMQRGVTLFETLIAVLLLSICALAFATVQLRGLQGNTSAMRSTKAVQLTQSLADRMRANQVALAAGGFDSITSVPATPSCGTLGTPCTPAQTAALDFVNWHDEVTKALPGGKGVVCLDATPDDGTATAVACSGAGPLAVKVFWTESGQTQRVALGVRP